MDQTSRENLEKSLRLLKAGKKAEAIPLLVGVLRKEPDSEPGWFLLGAALEAPKDKIRAFNEVLRINPHNEKAKQQLEKLRAQAKPLPHKPPFTGEAPAPKAVPPRRIPSPGAPSLRTPSSGTPSPKPQRPAHAQKPARSQHTGPQARKPSAASRQAQRRSPQSRPDYAKMRAPARGAGKPTFKDTFGQMWKSLWDLRTNIAGVIVLAIGLVLAWMVVSSLWKDLPLWLLGRKTDAIILSKAWGDFDINDPNLANEDIAKLVNLNMHYFFEYEFTTSSGETVVGKSEVTEAEFIGFAEGSQVAIKYSMLDPTLNRIDDARFVPFLVFTYSVFIIITLFTLAAGREMIDF